MNLGNTFPPPLISMAILWSVKTIFEKRVATVEIDTFISPELNDMGIHACLEGSRVRTSCGSGRFWPSGPLLAEEACIT